MANDRISVFEDLSNELIHEIFHYLHFHHAFESFYDLKERFQYFFLRSNLPIHINLSSISKSLFGRYLTQTILPRRDRIQSLRICNPFAADMYSFLSPVLNDFSRLETLVIHDIDSEHIQSTIDGLFSLPVLSSLTIKYIDDNPMSPQIYRKIFRLSALTYCQININVKSNVRLLPFATNEFSPIKYLIIESEVSLNQLDALLSYVPQLHRLSLGQLVANYGTNYASSNAVILNYLSNVSLDSCRMSFSLFESLVRNFFRQVQILRLTVFSRWCDSATMEYLSADRWQQLILTSIPNLRIFDFWYRCCSLGFYNIGQKHQTKINQFNSLFWTQHRWFFEFQYDKTNHQENILFYSTNPYR